jgi:hypothetical protein
MALDETQKRQWDVAFGIAAPFITVAGILVGVWQFNAGERNKTELEHKLVLEKDQVEFKRKLWLERLNAYRAVAELAGKVAAHAGDDQFTKLSQDFTALYWGTMVMVEDKAVEKAMIDLHLEIYDLANGWSNADRIKTRVNDLASVCRKSLETGVP